MTTKIPDKDILRLIQLAKKTQWDYKLSKYEDKALKKINKSVRMVQRNISKKLATIKPDSTFSVTRMNALADEMEALTKGIQAQLTKDISKTTITAGKASYEEHNKIASFDGRVPGFNHVALSAAQMKSLVTETKVGGKLLNEWVGDNFSNILKADFKTKITSGMLMGQSYKEMLKQFDSGVYKRFSNDMEGLTRTYVQSVNVNAMHDVAKANDDIIKGWKWNSVAENRTCIRCLSLDSRDKIYPIDGGPEMPLHIRCRCFPEYITKSFREMGLDIDEIKDSYKPYTIRGEIQPVTGKIKPGKIGVGGGKMISTGRFLGTYEDYFKGVSPAVKQQILGPTRYELWKSGKVSLSNMASKGGDIHLIKDLVKTKKVVKSSFVPAKTFNDIIAKPLPPHLAKFIEETEKVQLAGISKSQKKSIIAGLSDSVLRYSGKVQTIKWQKKGKRHLAIANKDHIQFQKTATKNVNKTAPKSHEYYKKRIAGEIKHLEESIKDPRRKSIVSYNKSKLANLKKQKRWASYHEAKDPLRTITAHEGFHNVYFNHELELPFIQALTRRNIYKKEEWFHVSEYGAGSVKELFAEVGASIISDIKIPQPFIDAFNEVTKGLKK